MIKNRPPRNMSGPRLIAAIPYYILCICCYHIFGSFSNEEGFF